MVGNKIRVLVVDDSMLFRTAISKALNEHPQLTVIATAGSAFEARDMIIKHSPDVMTLDVQMPKMTGIEFLKVLMPQRPMPVVMVSAVDGVVFEALRAGAVDFVEKPSSGGSQIMKAFTENLANTVMVAANAKLKIGRVASVAPKEASPTATKLAGSRISKPNSIIAMGASTGGTEATSIILKALPKTVPGIVVTQHMPPVFTKMYAQRLNHECELTVKEAEDNDIVMPGHVYIAPGDKHMKIVKRGASFVIHCAPGEKVSGHCPSVDVLFQSVAEFANKDIIGVILTGMGSDGANGLLAMRRRGAFTIGQDEKSSIVYGMPMIAAKVGAVAKQLPLDKIAGELVQYLLK